MDELVTNNGRGEIAWATENPNKLSRQLREAMNAAAANPELAKYGRLVQVYRICVRPGIVAAIPRIPFSEPVRRSTRIEHVSVTDVDAAVQAVVLSPNIDEFLFPALRLTDDLLKWTIAVGFEVIEHGDVGVTIRRKK